MTPTATIDLSGLNGLIYDFQDALIGAGEDGDLPKTVKDQGRLLAWEASTQLGPKKESRGEAKVLADVKQTFAPGPVEVFEFSKRQGAGGDSGLTWLYSGPDFLVGVPQENLQPAMSATTMRSKQRELNEQVKGKAWTQIGKRGKQVVMKWNRIVVKRSAFESLLKMKNKRVGRMRATFAYAAHRLGMDRIPRWISRHFETVAADGAAIYNDAKLNDRTAPSIEFGSSVPGIENFTEQINNAVDRRFHLLTAKIQNIISGYAGDCSAGRRIKRKA